MKRRKLGLVKRIVSLTLAVALIATSVSVAAPEAKAASGQGMGTSEVLSATHVKDTKVLQYYRILANMVEELGPEDAATEVGEKDAQTVIDTYAAEYDQADVVGIYLTEYPGKINFGTMEIQYVEGIGWARSATEIDMSQATYLTPMTKVPDSEFNLCTKLEKITLPETVTEIGNNAFESCQSLTTLSIGTGEDGIIDLTNVKTVGASAFSVCTSITDVAFAPYTTAANELKLGASAFSGCKKITSIEVPIKSAANLGANAFENCSYLNRVGLYDDLEYINNAVFQGTGIGTDVDFSPLDEKYDYYEDLSFYIIGEEDDTTNRLPENITYIGDNAFKSARIKGLDLSTCTRLTTLKQYSFGSAYVPELILPESLTTIDLMAFNVTMMDEESTLVIPESCVNIKSKAFYDCFIYSIQLPKSLTKIEASVFEKSEVLDGERIVIPSGSKLEEIGDCAFMDCESLETTAFLENCTKLTKLGDQAFADCYTMLEDSNGKAVKNLYGDRSIIDGLRTVILPDSVVTLGDSVFADNYALRSVDLGTGVVNIPAKTFYNEEKTGAKSGAGLEKVIVSDELEIIGDSAFENQSRLTTVGYSDGTNVTVEEGTVQFNEGLLSIGDSAFSGCGIQSNFSVSGAILRLKKEKVYTEEADGRDAYLVYDYMDVDRSEDYCKTVYVDEADLWSVAEIQANEAYYNKTLKAYTAEYYDTFEELGVLAKKVYVDPTVLLTESEYNALRDRYGLSFPTTEYTSFAYAEQYNTVTDGYESRLYSSTSKNPLLYCHEDDYSVAVFRTQEEGTTPLWVDPVSSSKISNLAVAKMASQSFAGANYVFGMQNVIIPESVADDKLGKMAFKDCVNLNEVKLSSKITEIKESTFAGAGGEVTNFFGTNDLLKYYDYYGLKSINIPDGVTRIDDNAFNSCLNLTLTKKGGSSFGRSVTYIGETAFSGCVSLTEVYFPDTLKEIGEEAFSCCALKYKDPYELDYEDSSVSPYKYYRNVEEYGTKEMKTGLTVIDFTAALNLETIGKGAFRMTNVKDVNFIDSPLVTIPDSLFEQCTFLKTIAFQAKTESIGSGVLKDAVNLSGVTMPASATVEADVISGAYGAVVGRTEPSITYSYDKNEVIVIPYGSSLRLPINAINSANRNGAIKISVDTGNGVFENILNTEAGGLYAEVGTSEDPYAFVLHGKEYIDEAVTVRVEVGVAYPYADPKVTGEYCITSQTMEYQVKVAAIPTKSVTVTAEGDSSVAANPNMYVQEPSKILYMPARKAMIDNGITLSAEVDPAETTEDISWTCDNSECFTISDVAYDATTGVATAVVKVNVDASGNAMVGMGQITVKSGTKSDTLTVYSVIAVPSLNNIVCTTNGSYLGTDLKPNTANNPYTMDIGAQDKINVTMNYGNTSYTEEQIAEYGEKYVFVSSDPSVIEVKADGTINAIKAGTATISVKGQASATTVNFYFEVGEGLMPSPSSVTISGPNAVNMGESIQLTANVLPERADQDVTWSVFSGANCISVDENGKVTGLNKGSGTVVATSVEKNTVKSTAYKIDVLAPATEFKMLSGDITLQVGATQRVNKSTNNTATSGYYVYPTDTTDSITWSSSDESIATVNGSATGVTVKAVAPGNATITGKTSSGLQASFNINVILKVTGIKVSSAVALSIGGTHQLNPEKVPANATEEVTYTYTTGNAKVATVSETGLITAIGAGSTNITVKTNTGKAANCRVTVKASATPGATATAAPSSTAVPATKLTVLVNKPNAKKIYMAKGQNLSVKTKMEPVNTTDKLTYTSNKPKVATVSASGTITAKKKGTAKITITATSGKKTTITVVVSKKQVRAKKVKVKCAKSMKRGKTIKLKVTLNAKKSTDTLSFSTNKSAIATVDAYGYVTAKNKKGKVKITVRTSSGKKATKTIKVK